MSATRVFVMIRRVGWGCLLGCTAMWSLACGFIGIDLLPFDEDSTDAGNLGLKDASVDSGGCQPGDEACDAGGDDGGLADSGTDSGTGSGTDSGADSGADSGIAPVLCDERTEMFEVGSHMLVPGGCTSMHVLLWGGGGASGDGGAGYWGGSIRPGIGGAGGYAERTFEVEPTSVVQLHIGIGGQGCGDTAESDLDAELGGGAGGAANAAEGEPGAGSTSGGAGGEPTFGGNGGAGRFGGGGGGAGSRGSLSGYIPYGQGGRAGAATLINVDDQHMVAGGGGGGGGTGAEPATTLGLSGGDGGSGCSAPGVVETSRGGGGGGGGACLGGATMEQGMGNTPYDPEGLLPEGHALGGEDDDDCRVGGDGYAIVTFTH